MSKQGLIYVYTGDGKGKTTAAVGQIVRALGHNLKTCYVSFHKDYERWGYSELRILKKLGVDVFTFACQHPHFHKKVSSEKLRAECKRALNFIENKIFKRGYDLVVLDEINIALREGYIKERELLMLLDAKPAFLNLILTGREATLNIIKRADLVSHIKKLKHPFDKGIKIRKGIEF